MNLHRHRKPRMPPPKNAPRKHAHSPSVTLAPLKPRTPRGAVPVLFITSCHCLGVFGGLVLPPFSFRPLELDLMVLPTPRFFTLASDFFPLEHCLKPT